MSINYRDFGGIISRIEPYYKTPLFSHKCDKLEKVRELFQVSRWQNHIAQQVTLPLRHSLHSKAAWPPERCEFMSSQQYDTNVIWPFLCLLCRHICRRVSSIWAINVCMYVCMYVCIPEEAGQAISELSRELSTNQIALFSHRVLK